MFSRKSYEGERLRVTVHFGSVPRYSAKGAANLRSLLLACTLPQVLAEPNYWLSGLNPRMPASVFEHLPAGSTRTTPSSSAQNPRIPVVLIVSGVAEVV